MATQWFVRTKGKVEGPMSSSELLRRVRAEEVTAETPVRKNDSKWFPAQEVNGLFDAAFKGRSEED